jgi:AcrR family transcriptional regulator
MSPRARPRARPRRTRDPADKRARLMDAARTLFAERGYAATTTADVARHAGVSEGIVFHHFGSKADLLEAVASDYGRGLAQAMFEIASAAAGQAPPADRMLRAAFAYAREHGTVVRLLRLSPAGGETQSARRASRAEIVAALAAGFARWSDSGGLRPMDPQIAAELVFALVEAAIVECFAHGDGAREADYLREAIACVEGALMPRARSSASSRATPDPERPRT